MADVLKTKVCNRCKIEKPLDEFYHSIRIKDRRFGTCIECQRIKRKIYEETQDMPHKVPSQPGKYTDEKQKEKTFQLLILMGWKYNKKNGIWWKLPRKDKNGIWIFPRRKPKKEPYVSNGIERKYRKHTSDIIKKRKLKLLTPPPGYRPKKRISENIGGLPIELFPEIRKEYQQEGMTQERLAYKYGVSYSYINQIIHYKV